MPNPQPLDSELRTVFIHAGGITCDRIEAGTIQDPDGSLAALTDAVIADLRAADDTAAGQPQSGPAAPRK